MENGRRETYTTTRFGPSAALNLGAIGLGRALQKASHQQLRCKLRTQVIHLNGTAMANVSSEYTNNTITVH